MKILTVDIGNTNADLCLFEGGKPIKTVKVELNKLEKALEDECDLVVVCAVNRKPLGLLRGKYGSKLKILKKEDIPIEVDYETLETLGTDRVLLAFGAESFYSENAVVVSAGTALVIDLVLEGVFRGGFITAGVGLKLKALGQATEGIPLYEPEKLDLTIGRSTYECTVAGVLLETKSFVEKTVSKWEKEFGKKLEVIVTGGDGALLKDIGIYDPLLSHKSMIRVVEKEMRKS